ncbi:hypothetical protein NC653_005543 [Populus alba x Populus x berolinensis]|uniref:Uncharacterized protein n=1 Tax=Populus alba x Populus x berolinensis TaxID=444605 RepID=A0AAD6WBH6_9ROSI|nr:hypothetical protein NC653_005543 [Populus alba x Populus x berolinensis]
MGLRLLHIGFLGGSMQQNSGEGHVFDHTLEYFSPLHP